MRVKTVARMVIEADFVTLIECEAGGKECRVYLKNERNEYLDYGVCACRVFTRADDDTAKSHSLPAVVGLPNGRGPFDAITSDPRFVALVRRGQTTGNKMDTFPDREEALAELYSGQDAYGGKW